MRNEAQIRCKNGETDGRGDAKPIRLCQQQPGKLFCFEVTPGQVILGKVIPGQMVRNASIYSHVR